MTTGQSFRPMVCPDVLRDAAGEPCDYQIDHVERVIWISPGLSNLRRAVVVEHANRRAAEETAALATVRMGSHFTEALASAFELGLRIGEARARAKGQRPAD